MMTSFWNQFMYKSILDSVKIPNSLQQESAFFLRILKPSVVHAPADTQKQKLLKATKKDHSTRMYVGRSFYYIDIH